MVRQRYKEYDSNNIRAIEQGDKVQREGVLSFHDEKTLLKIASTNFTKNVESMKESEQLENENNINESLDLIDEMNSLDKAIKYGKKKYKEEEEEIQKKVKEFKQNN